MLALLTTFLNKFKFQNQNIKYLCYICIFEFCNLNLFLIFEL